MNSVSGRTPTEVLDRVDPQTIQDLELREEWQDDGFPRFDV